MELEQAVFAVLVIPLFVYTYCLFTRFVYKMFE